MPLRVNFLNFTHIAHAIVINTLTKGVIGKSTFPVQSQTLIFIENIAHKSKQRCGSYEDIL